MHAIKYSEQKAQWFAECVNLDDTTELIPESSKTPGGEILISALQGYYPESLGAMIEDYEARRAMGAMGANLISSARPGSVVCE